MRKSIGNQAVEAPPQSGLSQLLKANQSCMVYPLWRQEEDNSAHSARRRRQRAEGRELQRTSTWSAYLNTVLRHICKQQVGRVGRTPPRRGFVLRLRRIDSRRCTRESGGREPRSIATN